MKYSTFHYDTVEVENLRPLESLHYNKYTTQTENTWQGTSRTFNLFRTSAWCNYVQRLDMWIKKLCMNMVLSLITHNTISNKEKTESKNIFEIKRTIQGV